MCVCLDSEAYPGGAGQEGGDGPPSPAQRQRQSALPGGHHQGGVTDPPRGPSVHPPCGPHWHQVHSTLPFTVIHLWQDGTFASDAMFVSFAEKNFKLVNHCSYYLFFASPHFSVALGISQWGRELESSSTCGLCTMMRRNGKTLSSSTQVRGHLFVMCHILMHWSVIF